jgi:hypothetical protein
VPLSRSLLLPLCLSVYLLLSLCSLLSVIVAHAHTDTHKPAKGESAQPSATPASPSRCTLLQAGRTPLDLAKLYFNRGVARLLREHGARD